METLTNPEIVGGFNRREARAIDWVYLKFYGYVSQVVSIKMHNSSEVSDLVSEVFTKLLQSKKKFQSLRKIKQYLGVAAKNICRNRNRKLANDKAKYAGFSRMYPDYQDPFMLAAEDAVDYRSLVYQAIEQLPRQRRYIFLLYYREGLSNDQIAKKLGIAEKSVANEKSKAMKALKMEFKPKTVWNFLLNFFL